MAKHIVAQATTTPNTPSAEQTPASAPPMGYVHPLTPSEILIDIRPRGQVIYSGTLEQIVAEGVLSRDVPAGIPGICWEEGMYWYWLIRSYPAGAKKKDCPGPIDYWHLTVRLAANKGTGFAAARRHDLEQALREAKFNLSEGGRALFRRYLAARQDTGFQRLLVAVGAAELRPKRKAKTQPEADRTGAKD